MFNKIAMDNGLVECFSLTDGAREKCKRLIASLLTASLKNEVKQRVRFTDKDEATNPKLLFDLIAERVTEHERQYQCLKKQKREANGRDASATKNANSAKRHKLWTGKPPQAVAVVGAAKAKADQKPRPPALSRPPPGPCPKCKAMHWLRECTLVTEDEKAEILQSMHNARKAKKARLKRLGEFLPTSDRQVTLNGVLELPYCPDSGSDYTVNGRSHWKRLCAAVSSVTKEKFGVPMRTQAFGATEVTAESKAQLQVLIHTAGGSVGPMGLVDVLIVDVDDDEFIVGNDLLVTLGIEVDRQLEQLGDHSDDQTSGNDRGNELTNDFIVRTMDAWALPGRE